MPHPSETHRAIEAVWRIESARLIAGLARLVRDIGLAEELAHDALVAALEQWPTTGVPANPGAWLMTAGQRRAIDHRRRVKRRDAAHQRLGREARPAMDADPDDDFGDDLLRLVFTCCHPVLSRQARVALTLRLLGGLTTDEIARAFLAPEPTIAQRIARAKRTLSDRHVPFEVPRGAERAGRLSSVLEVVYLIYNEGYTATSGPTWARQDLCDEALRLGRVLAELAPAEPEVLGLVALMEIQSSRLRARVGPTGDPVLLLDQDRGRWDRVLVGRGMAALARAAATGGAAGPYQLQAGIAACHARAPTAADTDWQRLASLYGELARVAPSPVVELNRAVVVAKARGPQAGLDVVEPLLADASMGRSHLLPAVRGDLLAQLGRSAEARAEFQRAAALTRNERERQVLSARAAALE